MARPSATADEERGMLRSARAAGRTLSEASSTQGVLVEIANEQVRGGGGRGDFDCVRAPPLWVVCVLGVAFFHVCFILFGRYSVPAKFWYFVQVSSNSASRLPGGKGVSLSMSPKREGREQTLENETLCVLVHKRRVSFPSRPYLAQSVLQSSPASTH